MDLAIFEHFTVIAEKLSFTKAAEELEKSESVLSRQMVRLESELGLDLFKRSTRKVELTPAGEILYQGINDSFDAFYNLLEKARNANEGDSGVIKIAVMQNYSIPDRTFNIIHSFGKTYEKIEVELVTANLSDFVNLLAAGQVDFVFSVIDDYNENPDISSIFTEATKTYLLVSPDLPVLEAKKATYSIADFKDCDILMGSTNKRKQTRMREICEEAGFTPNFRFILDDAQYHMAIRQGLGFGITDDTHLLTGDRTITHLYVPELSSCRLGFSYVPEKISGHKKIFLDYVLKASE